ncbi:dihydroneopterin aldolase family protein [Methanohalophilus sp.]|uniref:dihydroneopterin aldolase family protein n=1 Tax=Methanohalophilus sp. TaxID=1966352 RepID=UPI00260F6F6A|nr:dihydroneopterin aldolase family protein [Methanohalophilus sp.]MDK2892880.1 dihydroneopterin aldolase [Methanohalophilus sp.]
MSEKITDAQIAAFEAGIKLGALYHQFTGSPISLHTIKSLEKAIAESISVQPYVENITVHIDRDMVKSKLNDEFGYCELEGQMLTVKLIVAYKNMRLYASMEYERELDYPLMKIEKVESSSK